MNALNKNAGNDSVRSMRLLRKRNIIMMMEAREHNKCYLQYLLCNFCHRCTAVIAQLGERKTEDLKVSGSIPDCGSPFMFSPVEKWSETSHHRPNFLNHPWTSSSTHTYRGIVCAILQRST